MATASERCSCGAELTVAGMNVRQLLYEWRISHPCPNGNGSKWKAERVIRKEDPDE